MPAATSINGRGLLKEDLVANFVVLPNYHEDEAIIRNIWGHYQYWAAEFWGTCVHS